jgi:hypothetical protein
LIDVPILHFVFIAIYSARQCLFLNQSSHLASGFCLAGELQPVDRLL